MTRLILLSRLYDSNGIPELSIAFDFPLSPVRLLITPFEPQTQRNDQNDDKNVTPAETTSVSSRRREGKRDIRDSGIHSGPIAGRVLFTENQTTHDTPETTKSNKGSTGESTSPLSTHIVRLVRHTSGNIGIGTGDSKENTRIPRGITAGESHHRQSNNGEQSVEDQDRSAHAVFIADPSCAVHDDSCEGVGWCDEALRFAYAVAHS